MHKVVPSFTTQHYIANKYHLLIGFENSRDQCFKTKTETAEFRSRDQDRGVEDYNTAYRSHICTVHVTYGNGLVLLW